MTIANCKLQISEKAGSRALQFTICILHFAFCNSLPASENWPDYRGPRGQGVSDATGLPLTWSETQNVRWKTAIPGTGWSSPVVWGDQVWMTTANESGTERSAVAVDGETGAIVHNVKVFDVATVVPQHDLNSHASPSPVIEGDRVYVHFGTYGTACLDTETGRVLWGRTDLNLDHQVGPGSSPILFDDLLIVHCDGTDVQYIVALDKRTGQTVWKTPRTAELSSVSPAMRKSSCTPLIVRIDGEPVLLSLAAHALYGYDPLDGRELWKVPFSGYSNVSRPVTDGELAVISTGYDRAELLGIEIGPAGGAVRWTSSRNAPAKPSPLLIDGLVYCVDDGGIASCVDAATGEQTWRHRIGGEHSASPIYVDGHIYFFDQSGKTTVMVPDGQQYQPIAVNELDDGFMASPAVAGKALFLRTKTHLYRIEEIAK